jgi:undecaprenyl-diphosphatase
MNQLAELSTKQEITPSRWERFWKIAGSFYAIALLVGVTALWGFVWLASEVLEQEFASLNHDVLIWVHSYATPTLTRIAFAFTDLGSVVGVTLLTCTLGLFFIYNRRFMDALTLLVLVIGGGVLVFTLKNAFGQIRPHVFTPLAVEKAFSFPSGHSLLSFCFWGFLAVWLVIQKPRELWRWLVGLVCLAIAGMVALSRLYLGVHWPTDVVAGMLAAAFWIAVCFSGQRIAVARRQRRADAFPSP